MSTLVSQATGYPVEFDTIIPDLTDIADIREAFIAYHLGVNNFNASTDVPAEQSIHGHIESFKNLLETSITSASNANAEAIQEFTDLLEGIGASAVLTVGGTPNQVSVSASAGFVTISLPNYVEIESLTAKEGVNVFSNSSTRNSTIISPEQGTLAYLQDSSEFSVYNGSSWVGIQNHGPLGDRIDSAEVLALLGL